MDWNKIKMDKISIEVDKYFFCHLHTEEGFKLLQN